MVAECMADTFVNFYGHVSREEALAAQRKSSAVLLLEAMSTKKGGILTGKLYEYMASGTPVILVGDGSDTELNDIVRRTGIGKCATDSEEELMSAVMNITRSKVPDWFSPDLAEIAKYSREYSANRMMDTIRLAVERN